MEGQPKGVRPRGPAGADYLRWLVAKPPQSRGFVHFRQEFAACVQDVGLVPCPRPPSGRYSGRQSCRQGKALRLSQGFPLWVCLLAAICSSIIRTYSCGPGSALWPGAGTLSWGTGNTPRRGRPRWYESLHCGPPRVMSQMERDTGLGCGGRETLAAVGTDRKQLYRTLPRVGRANSLAFGHRAGRGTRGPTKRSGRFAGPAGQASALPDRSGY